MQRRGLFPIRRGGALLVLMFLAGGVRAFGAPEAVQRVTLDLKNATLQEAFLQIEKQTDYALSMPTTPGRASPRTASRSA